MEMQQPKSIFTDQEILNSTSYRVTQEVFNSITHGIGFLLSVYATNLLIQKGLNTMDLTHIIAYAIFSISMCVMFFNSMIYHALYFTTVKPVFQFFDHASIYLLIAGSYTPFALILLGGWHGWALMGFEWLLAAIGLTAKATNAKWIKKYSTWIYLLMGWAGILMVPDLVETLGAAGIGWLLFGGIAYSIGTIFYKYDRQIAYFHVIWHFFVILGALGIFVSIYAYI